MSQQRQKSHQRVKKEATQEFFNKKRTGSAGPNKTKESFTFNKAPINKQDAKKEIIEQKDRPAKRSAFTAKLYADDDEVENMKILQGDQFESDEETRQPRQRDQKAKDKLTKEGFVKQSKSVSTSKIGKLAIGKGSVCLFAVAEVHPGQYAILNHTRNVKGYLSLKARPDTVLKVGQLVVAAVSSVGMAVNEQGIQSKKLQLSIEPASIYGQMQAAKVTPGMMLQGFVESKEEKGYFIQYGFKDGAKGFLKYADCEQKLEVGHLCQTVVTQAYASTKLIKCTTNFKQLVQSTDSVLVNEHTLKAGFLVQAKVAKLYENGLAVSFLGGMQGTVFCDHLSRDSIAKFKVGERIQARVISHDVVSKATCLSLLPHLTQMQACSFDVLVGQTYDKVKVQNQVYGGSYKVQVPGLQSAFLHKSHLPGANPQTGSAGASDDEDAKKKKPQITELKAGQLVDKVRVKELNFFDNAVHLTMRPQIVNSEALSYSQLQVGQFVNATIDRVNEVKKTVDLKLNDFVKGQLRLEHMADGPSKNIPQKFTTVGKQIKVRVFSMDDRKVQFTKKDLFMKHDTPIYENLAACKKQDPFTGLIVAENEHGYILTSFNGVKGLLKFTDVAQHLSKKQKQEIKVGTCLQCYILWCKRDKGLALTLDKNAASKKQSDESESLQDFFPSDEELKKIKDEHSQLFKQSTENVHGKSFTWKVLAVYPKFFLLKSVLDKKAKLAVLPKPMTTAFGLSLPFDQEDFTLEATVVSDCQKVPVVSVHPLAQSLRSLMPATQADLATPCKPMLGFVSQVSADGVQLIFSSSLTAKVSQKDLQHTRYQLGQPVVCAVNKSGRISLKDLIVQKASGHDQTQLQRQALLNAFSYLHELSCGSWKLGQKVQVTVQLVKDYGLICKVDDQWTGFIVNEHLTQKRKHYKPDTQLTAYLLDVDNDKKIIDLCEQLPEPKKPQILLSKQHYVLTRQQQTFGVSLFQHVNDHSAGDANSAKPINSPLTDVRSVPCTNANKKHLDLLVLKSQEKPEGLSNEVREGQLVSGVVKSVKGHCLFVQVGQNGKTPLIGRLQRVEVPENDSVQQVGERIQVKVLSVTKDGSRQLIELTKRKEHLSLPNGQLAEVLSLESLKDGQKVSALITDVLPESSNPIQIQVSALVYGSLCFSDIASPADLQKTSFKNLLAKFKPGQRIEVTFRKGQFYLYQPPSNFKRGDLCIARYVKQQQGHGCTVQLTRDCFGSIQYCEITDEILGAQCSWLKTKGVFLARVIDTDKNGRPRLSTRQSVLADWQLISQGATAHFQQQDQSLQAQGNLRNKLLKFGPKLSIAQNQLFLGFVSNLSKAGCFVQVGHQCTVRVGLNELSDESDFDFQKEMPVGRIVVGRITKVLESSEGDMRFNGSLRRSIVEHGCGQLQKNQLKANQEHPAQILAVSQDSCFCQLLGTYLKAKVKSVPKKFQAGQLIQIKLVKIELDNIKAEYSKPAEIAEVQRAESQKALAVFNSVHEESRQDVHQAQSQEASKQTGEIDVAAAFEKRREKTAIEQQISDLKAIQELEEASSGDDAEEEGEDDDEEMEEEDSDAEEMARIQQRIYESSEEESDEQMDSADSGDEEQGEDEDVEMDSESESAESGSESKDAEKAKKEKKGGKKALREKITEEKNLRLKEQQIRQTHGAKPQTQNDFERLLVADQDQSYLWIQYIAFMLDKLDANAARRVAERAVAAVSITAEADKLNLWIAFMNLEAQFGTQQQLQDVVKRALEVNDQQKVYLQLIQIYRQKKEHALVEPIFKKLCKKYHTSLDIWSSYIEFLFDKPEGIETTPKQVLQKALQALPKNLHVSLISKFGIFEYRTGQQEAGRTMFEGIVTNYPRRMDIWAVYMDSEVKHGSPQNARHLFERCLSQDEIRKKPRSMKLVFRKYMEFEVAQGNQKKVDALRQRVEEYLSEAFKQDGSSSSSDSESA